MDNLKFLVSVKYDKNTDNPIYTMFDDSDQSFEKIAIPREDSFSYFLQRGIEDTKKKTAEQQVFEIIRTANPEAVERVESIERVKKYNLFTEQWEELMKINMKTAMDVKRHRFETCHEGHIKRVTRHMLDKRWYMGMPYDDDYELIRPDVSSKKQPLIDMGYPERIVTQLLEMLYAPIPKISFMSFDIECETLGKVRPNIMYASTPIISASFEFYDHERGRQSGLVLLLDNDLRRLTGSEENLAFTELVTQGRIRVEIFSTEYELIMRIIEVLEDISYPLVLTYFGEGFDLPYLFNRAINLGINRRRLPFYAYKIRGVRRMGMRTNWRCKFPNKMHIDLLQFFAQPSIQNYVFKGEYKKHGLEDVSQALLGRGKVQHDTSINEMGVPDLGYYNFVDANLTLDLLMIDDFRPLKVIIMMMRIGRQGHYEAAHRAIGNKILNLVQGTLVEHDILIPNRHDLLLVGEAHSNPDIKGKGYRGAIVIPTEPGVWRNICRTDFACFSDDTEILTQNGWRGLYDIDKEDLVASVNIQTKNVEYERILGIHEYDYDGEMFHYFVSGGLDLLVTPNHRMVYRKRDRTGGRKKLSSSLTWTKEWFIKEAQNINRYWYSIPTFGVWNGVERDINIGSFTFTPEQFLPFLGWLLSDGCMTHHDKLVSGELRQSITVSQRRKENIPLIRKAFKGLGLNFSEIRTKNGEGIPYTVFRLNNSKFCRALSKWFGGLLKSDKKYIPREILELDKKSLELLFNAMMNGDGSFTIRMNKRVPEKYSTTSIGLASDFQELALKVGFKCSIRSDNYRTSFGDKEYSGVMYSVSFSYTRKNVINGQRQQPIKKHYRGKVWCVSVPNGTVIIRRNGKVCVTGNSLYPTMMREKNLSFDSMNCSHEECKDNLVPELPHHACKVRPGIMSTLIGCLKDIRLLYFKPLTKDTSLTEEERNTYKSIEQGIKIFVNASYGVSGYKGFGLYCESVAESITAWSRDAISRLAIALERRHGNDLVAVANEYNRGRLENEWIDTLDALKLIPAKEKRIIAGDTDSIMFPYSKDDVEFLIEFAEKELGTELALEIIAPLAIFYKKKNYILVDENGKVEVKGMLGKKRNTPQIVVKCFDEFLELLKMVVIEDVPKENLRDLTIDLIKTYYDKIWEIDGEIEDYSIETQMTKSISEYERPPQHVKAAKKLIEHIKNSSVALSTTRDDQIVPPGSFIKYVKKIASGIRTLKPGKKSSNVKCDPVPIEIATKDDVSPYYYHDNLLSVMGQVMGALNITPEDVSTLSPEQTAVDEFFQ